MTREHQEKLAEQCIKELTAKYELNPNLLKYFLEGKVYYTEEIIPYCIASMDNITYDSRFVDIVREFEMKSGALVYHAILKGQFFCMLYIGTGEDIWLSSLSRQKMLILFLRQCAISLQGIFPWGILRFRPLVAL